MQIVLCVMIMVIILFIYARFIEPKRLIVKHKTLAKDLKMKIVLFSDTHFGPCYSQYNLEKIVQKINEQNADIVIFAGDFMDDNKESNFNFDVDYIKNQLSKIKGEKFAVRGNHDLYCDIIDLYSEIITSSGFKLLINESVYLEKFDVNITGFDDYSRGIAKTDLYKNLSGDKFNIAVMHEANYADLINKKAFGTVLSGHSHGGQIYVPILSKYVLPTGAKKYPKGFYGSEKTKNNMDVFVSSGIGMTTIPMRFLNAPEIVVLEYKPEKN